MTPNTTVLVNAWRHVCWDTSGVTYISTGRLGNWWYNWSMTPSTTVLVNAVLHGDMYAGIHLELHISVPEDWKL